MTDLQIANNCKLKDIFIIGEKININEEYIEKYGNNKGKISLSLLKEKEENPNAKLILVTAINPTPFGEGKTTVSIGLSDAINKINKSIVVLREPSLGPVFGKKGGATGGGKAQVVPMEDINLHFTGDIHAITSANNLLSAMIDNHIFQGNKLKIKKVVWNRCLDLNDRSLRKIKIGYSKKAEEGTRFDSFDISVASEIMAILCLSKDVADLKSRLDNIIIGYDDEDNEIYAKDIKATGALTVLLKDAIKPNLVQTLENNPAIIHGGPFANIAHGCNSVIATKLALKLSNYVVTEAGFGSDLGAEKFLDIKTRLLPQNPSVVVCVATIRALKYHGGMPIEEISDENLIYLKKGMLNLYKHVDNIKTKFGLNIIVALNKFKTDTQNEIDYIINELNKSKIEISLVESWGKGSEGSLDLAKKVIKLADRPNNFKYCYDLEDNIRIKIEKVAKNIYGANKVEYTKEAYQKLEKIENSKYNKFPICIAKTPYSFSDDDKNIICDKEFSITVRDLIVKGGAKFIVVMAGNIFTMPGLPKIPAAENMKIDNDKIIGLF